MSNIKLFNKAMRELRRGNENEAHEIAKDIKCSYNFDDELEEMRRKHI